VFTDLELNYYLYVALSRSAYAYRDDLKTTLPIVGSNLVGGLCGAEVERNGLKNKFINHLASRANIVRSCDQ